MSLVELLSYLLNFELYSPNSKFIAFWKTFYNTLQAYTEWSMLMIEIERIWHSRIYISNSEQFNNGLQCFGLQSPITNIGNIDREDKKVANLVKL